MTTTEGRSSGSEPHGPYVPALGFRALTRLYDPLLRLTLREEEFKRRLIAAARIQAGHSVLDLGCGTGTLTIMLKRSQPRAVVTGLDGDPDVLDIAREKVEAAGVDVQFRAGLAFQLPFDDGSFDRALSSLVFHHLTTPDKVRAVAEVFRVLRPGGELHIADWGRPHNALMSVAVLRSSRHAATWRIVATSGATLTRTHVVARVGRTSAITRLARVGKSVHRKAARQCSHAPTCPDAGQS